MAICVKACVDCGGRAADNCNVCERCFVETVKGAHDPVNQVTKTCDGCDCSFAGKGDIPAPCFKEVVKRMAHDLVDSPDHYTFGGIECKDAIRAMLTEEEFRGWVKGSVVAYLWRERHKGGDLDISKSAKVLGWLKGEDK